MSSRGGSGIKKTKKQDSIELDSILKFIKLIQGISSGMLVMSIIGLILVGKNTAAQVVYTMVIVVDLIIIFGGMIPINYLFNKNK